VPCLYPFYLETFFAAGTALRRNDEEWLATIRAEAEMLEDRHAWAVELAVKDVTTGAPLRARSKVCEAYVSEECTSGHCPQPYDPERLQ
jgi:hypothetical protein